MKWEEIAALSYPVVREKMVGEEVFDTVQGHLEEYRANK